MSLHDPLADLRSAVMAHSSLLLRDLSLGSLGFPQHSIAERLKQRGQCWSRKPEPGSHLELIKRVFRSKSTAREWLAARGVRTPTLYWTGTANQPPDFSTLPNRFVLKPVRSFGCHGVVLYESGTDLMTERRIKLSDLADYMRACEIRFDLQKDPTWIVEEFVRDVDRKYTVPRDFKLTSAGGRCYLFYAVNRNDHHDRWTSSWYARPWVRISDRMNTNLQLGPDYPRPNDLDALFQVSDALAAKLAVFVRIDWYLTPDGPVFGEFTPFPNHGLGNTPVGERALMQMWTLFPDFPMDRPMD